MNTTMHGGGRRRSLWKSPALFTALVLLIPVLGDYFVDGWDWDLGGYVVVGTLIFGIGLTYELVTRNVDTIAFRAALGVALAAVFILVWLNFIQAADDVNPAAMMYLWVPLVGIIGAAMARFRPDGMARALFATALAQALVLAIALFVRNPQVTSWTPAVLRGFGLMRFSSCCLSDRRCCFGKPLVGNPHRRGITMHCSKRWHRVAVAVSTPRGRRH